MEFIQKNKSWLVPILFMLVITPLTPTLDMAIAKFFFDRGDGFEYFVNTPFLQMIYVYGLVPAQLTVILAIFALLLSYIPRCRSWRPHALFLVLTLAIGAGFISHTLLKDHWGRPRPKQVIAFGGQQEFRPYYRPNFFDQPEPSRSFPCGHCTMGFYFFTFILMGRRFKSHMLLYLGTALTVVLGLALSFTRMAQGGHFFSDVMMSALIMWLTALTFDWIIYEV